MAITMKGQPDVVSPSLLVTWTADAGKVGPNVIECLKEQLHLSEFAEIEPLGYFPVGGVIIDDDVIQFPASKFYECPGRDLLVLHSMQPQSKQFAFLSEVLDVAERMHVRELYICAGLGSRRAHIEKRRVRTISNMAQLKESLSSLGLETWMSYQGPPSINSFLLWVARNRGVPGATFWGEIPFYLSSVTDWRAVQVMLGVVDRKFNLNISFESMDLRVEEFESRLERLMKENLEVGNTVSRLERGEQLTREEAESLVRNVTDWF